MLVHRAKKPGSSSGADNTFSIDISIEKLIFPKTGHFDVYYTIQIQVPGQVKISLLFLLSTN